MRVEDEDEEAVGPEKLERVDARGEMEGRVVVDALMVPEGVGVWCSRDEVVGRNRREGRLELEEGGAAASSGVRKVTETTRVPTSGKDDEMLEDIVSNPPLLSLRNPILVSSRFS